MVVKEQEVEGAILSVLLDYESLGFNELCRKISDFSDVTINKYLKKMVSEGTIQKEASSSGEKSRFWIDPYTKTVYKGYKENMENATKILSQLVKELTGYLGKVDQTQQTSEAFIKMQSKILDILTKDVISWYDSYSIGIFRATCGALPVLLSKEIKQKYELQLKQIETLLKKVKVVDPIAYGLFLTAASGRFR